MTPTRRRVLTTVGAAVALSTAGCLGGDDAAEGPPPDTATTSVSIPNVPGDHTYETMGSGEEPTVLYYANWKCPACAAFSDALLDDIVETYVEPGDATLVHRALGYGADGEPALGDDAPRIARAGIALWHLEPESFWPYYKLVMSSQPSPSEQWGTTETLVEYAENADVEAVDEFRDTVEADEFDDEVRETTADAGQDGVGGTPWLVFGDESFNPLEDEDRTFERLDAFVS